MAYLGNQPKDPISVSTNAPSIPKNGDVWFNSALGETFVYYDDGDTAQWVQTNPSGQQGPTGPTGPAGANGEVLRTELDAYLQVANSTSFATTSQLDNYLQVANASSVTPDQLSQYLQVANLSNLSTSLIPSANVTYDLGSTTKYWKDLYLSGNTIFLGSAQITLNANGGIDLPAGSRTGGTAIGTGSGGGASVTIANTAPSSPSAGDLWWYGTGSKLYIYYDDGDSQQWVQATTPGATGPAGAAGAAGSSVTSYANTSVFPSSGNSVGDFAFATNTKAVYIWDGSEWDRISAGVDESPIILTEPVSSVILSPVGSNSEVTMLASDPEGFAVTYGIAYNNATNSLPAQLLSVPSIDQANGVYTFTPTSNTSLEGSFKARLSASDGSKTTTRLVDFTLAFWATISGGTTTSAGGYTYHTFTSSGSLTVSQTGTIDYIVVGGGGGGGGHAGGAGGGGGGVRYGNMLVNAGSVIVTVGSGGSGSGSTAGSNGGTGGDSILGSITASGGGAGAGHAGAAGNGGSGGGQAGGGATGPGSGNAGSYSPAEGNDGGAYGAPGYAAGGGGGGAGAAGQNSGVNASSDGGNGGNGYQWVDGNYYGGGGGGGSHHSGGSGGTGGQGGGGAGANGGVSNGSAGTPNTGGGGGGAGGLSGSFPGSGAAGGSGIVIVRVAT